MEPRRPIDARRLLRPPVVLFFGLLAVALLRVASAVTTATWGWGFDSFRYLDPALGGLLGLAMVATLIPAVARRLAPWAERAGKYAWLWLIAVAALLWLTPDRLHFLGDWLMRRGAVTQDQDLATLFPQALPLDLFLHVTLPRRLMQWTLLDSETVVRLMGVCEAALLTLLAVSFVRTLDAPPAPTLAATGALAFGGVLALFTGYNKAASEMCVLVAAVAFFGVRAARTGRGLLPLAIATSVAIALHRMGALLVPAFAAAWIAGVRAPGGATRPRIALALAALALPVATLSIVGPKVAQLVMGFDVAHHLAPPEVAAHGGWWSGLWSGLRLLDLVNAVAVLAPIAIAAVGLPFVLGRRLRRPESAVLLSLALPLALLMLIVHPQQGVFRDLDVFAPSALAFSFVTAHLIVEALRDAPDAQWLAVPVTTLAITSTTAWLLLNNDPASGDRWVRAFVTQPPVRTAGERALTWDYLGYRAMDGDRWRDAAVAWSHAAESAPSSRILTLWGMAETMVGDLPRARTLYERSVSLDSTQRNAWRGLASTSFRLGDYAQARRAVLQLERLHVDAPELPDLIEALDRLEAEKGLDAAPSVQTGLDTDH